MFHRSSTFRDISIFSIPSASNTLHPTSTVGHYRRDQVTAITIRAMKTGSANVLPETNVCRFLASFELSSGIEVRRQPGLRSLVYERNEVQRTKARHREAIHASLAATISGRTTQCWWTPGGRPARCRLYIGSRIKQSSSTCRHCEGPDSQRTAQLRN